MSEVEVVIVKVAADDCPPVSMYTENDQDCHSLAAGFEKKMIIITVLVCQSSTELRKTPATTCWACEDDLVFVARSSCFWLTYCKFLKIQADLAYHWITGHGFNGIFASAPSGSISRGVAWVLNIAHILQKKPHRSARSDSRT